MPFDDDDPGESLSSRRALERADHGKAERAEAQKKQEQKKELSKLKLDVLRQGMAPQKTEDASTGLSVTADRSGGDAAITKTREEETRRAVEDINVKPGAEEMIRKERKQEEIRRQAQYEQGKDQTA